MIKSTLTLNDVKKTIQNGKDQSVEVTLNLGRNKFKSFEGMVTGIYPALFTISPTDGFKGKTTYSYSEMLCGNVIFKE